MEHAPSLKLRAEDRAVIEEEEQLLAAVRSAVENAEPPGSGERARRRMESLRTELSEADSDDLAALANNRGEAGRYQEIYVHAKIMIVDDVWATIGSTNTADRSFKRDTELNASIWHGDFARDLRRELFLEHLGIETGDDDIAAFELFHERARANSWRKLAGAPLPYLAYTLKVALYGLGEPKRE